MAAGDLAGAGSDLSVRERRKGGPAACLWKSDGWELSPADRERCRDLFQEIAPVQVVWILGEADPKEEPGEWPDNVHRVPPGLKRYDFPEKDVVLWAESWSDEVWPDGFSQFIPKASQGQFQILMLHGEADQEVSSYHPIDMQVIQQMGIDYCALGQRNHPICWGREGAVWAAYAGQSGVDLLRRSREPGILDCGIGKRRNKLPAASSTCEDRQTRLRESGDHAAGRTGRGDDRRPDCSVVFECEPPAGFLQSCADGRAGGFLPINIETVRRLLVPSRFFSLTITDQTAPELSYDRIREANPDNLLGRYIATMQERIRKADSEGGRKLLESALAAGVEALLHSQEKGR